MRALVLAALVVVAVSAVTATQYGGSAEERKALLQEAISEAKSHSERGKAARAQASTKGHARISSKHFKQITKEARRQGEARLLFENMVHKAERKLAEAERQSTAGVQSAEERAEALAAEVFHRPGTLLSNEEIALMMQESDCRAREPITPEDCATSNFDLFRSFDGSCNNLNHPLLGAKDTALPRIIPSQYEDGILALRGNIQNRKGSILNVTAFESPNPSARHISQTVILDKPNDSVFTHMLMQFGQFIDHDLSLSPELEDECPERAEHCEFTEICHPIRVTDNDPQFGLGTSNNGACIAFSRSLGACPDEEEPQVNRGIVPRQQINVLTSFIDGSMVYGSDKEFADRLRLFTGGLLKEGSSQPGFKPELPRISRAENSREDGEAFIGCPESAEGELGCFLAGEFRVNEQIVLTVMHTLWFREHNRIARELARINPRWDDERLYQESRKIVGALLQYIVYYDYLPLILGREVYDIVIGDFIAYDDLVNPGVNNAFATAAYRYGHTLIRPFFDRLNPQYGNIAAGPLELSEIFFDSDQFRASYGTDPLVRGLITQPSRRVDEFLSTVLTSNLFREHLDLASLNMQRGRDHGLPPYVIFKRYCESVFPALGKAEFENTLTLIRLLEVYGSLDTVDLWVGGLAEKRLPGSLLGPTFSCLFGITFSNVRDGDRFFYKADGVFTPEQRDSIEQHSLATIICDNGDNINSVQKDVFQRQPRIPCLKIPRVDLSLWQDSGCHYRITIARRRFILPIIAKSISSSVLPSTLFTDDIPASREQTSHCIPVSCPGASLSTLVGFGITRIPPGTIVRTTRNTALPRNVLVSPSYGAFWPKSLFGAAGTGIYNSLRECDAGTDSALSIRFLSSTGVIEPVRLPVAPVEAKTEEEEATTSAGEVPSSLGNLFLEFFRNSATTEEPPTTTTDETTGTGGPSDAQLMSDLEDALKSLNP